MEVYALREDFRFLQGEEHDSAKREPEIKELAVTVLEDCFLSVFHNFRQVKHHIHGETFSQLSRVTKNREEVLELFEVIGGVVTLYAGRGQVLQKYAEFIDGLGYAFEAALDQVIDSLIQVSSQYVSPVHALLQHLQVVLLYDALYYARHDFYGVICSCSPV